MTDKIKELKKLEELIDEYTQPNEIPLEKDLHLTRLQVETLQSSIQAYLEQERSGNHG